MLLVLLSPAACLWCSTMAVAHRPSLSAHSAPAACWLLMSGPLQQCFNGNVLPHHERQQWLKGVLTTGSTCLQVTIDKDHTLTIEGERKQEHEENDKGVRRIERSYGVFVRRFQVGGCNEGWSHLCPCDAAAAWLLAAVACKGVYHHCSGAVSRWAAWSVKGQLV